MNTDSKNNDKRPSVLLLFGPTAVGKTELLLELFAGRAEVVSADSVQVYRGMNIGTAKPTQRVRDDLPHHLVDIRNPDEGYSVGDFVKEADRLIPGIIARGRLAIVSGGSAFYLRNFVYGLPQTPKADRQTKRELEREREERGLEALRAELERVDPQTAGRLPAADTYRIVRALEVYRTTGRPLSSFVVPEQPREDYELLIVGLDRPRRELYRRIDDRVHSMMIRGLSSEVESLLAAGYGFGTPAMKAIGYREFAGYVKGEHTLERVEELIKRNSRRYAKRQITFFKQLPNVVWTSPHAKNELRSLIERFAKGSPVIRSQ